MVSRLIDIMAVSCTYIHLHILVHVYACTCTCTLYIDIHIYMYTHFTCTCTCTDICSFKGDEKSQQFCWNVCCECSLSILTSVQIDTHTKGIIIYWCTGIHTCIQVYIHVYMYTLCFANNMNWDACCSMCI